ncbi:BON domain-containing protein [Rathayibacter sp. VKM Ac-2754]|uniref:BON domain-containing protein n=1 Tax=Rathayibacter sp. VKM Ac-2754 TaxID=2609251 RepID=UPI00135BD459|nr:BON domain-containing protein [Rathayibacter sp. VKM Ac-2754]MWV59772.1 BON domain-containing protein [Rathayibacter sp. VKM Ac-2754]
MTSEAPARTDQMIQIAVQDELNWTSGVHAAQIGVAVEHGAVTLSGEVRTYVERLSACRAALRVHGVRTLVDELAVRSERSLTINETDFAESVQGALTSEVFVPETVKAEIHGRSVVLMGEVHWDYERESARKAVARVNGVEDVTSVITLRARPSATDALQRISEALVRDATVDAGRIEARLDGTRLTLSGTVSSWPERRAAERAAWSSPSITHLQNDLVVTSY